MKQSTLRATNLLGATILGLHDRLKSAVLMQDNLGGESAPAIVALGHQPGLSNDGLSKLLGLTHTGTVRLVDKLVKQEILERRSSEEDKRAVRLFLTNKGEQVRKELLSARQQSMSQLLGDFNDSEIENLEALLSKLLMANSNDDLVRLRMCRLCDGPSCGNCPIHVPV